MSIPQLFLDSKQAKHFDGRHPWLLERSVVEPTVSLEPGTVVEVLQPNGSWIGRGIYNPSSRIRVRLLQWEQNEQLNEDWLREKLRLACDLRDHWQSRHHSLDAVRLVNSEGDGLSGLIVDRFGEYLQLQISSLAIQAWLEPILGWLEERFQPNGIHLSIDASVAKQEGMEPLSEWVRGSAPDSDLAIDDEGVALSVDLQTGQKTGYYLDQRMNRVAAAEWMHDGSLLDVCCYQGGFTLAAQKRREISRAVAVDSSMRALEQADANAKRNGCEDIDFVQADCFDYLQQLVADKEQFDNVVLDPPRMAGNRHQITSALRAYHRLNLSAVNVLRPGGILISCSCSGRVLREDFWGVLSSVAKRSRRTIQLLDDRSADFDHPIDVNCPESDYLKCFVCRVH